jgi:uncharacterized membrane protein YecN with MAPEG domain
MVFPTITAGYAGVLGLILFALSFWVIGGRGQYRIVHGDGGRPELNRRIRAHGNFTEYVPMILVLAALIEASGGGPIKIHWLLGPLTLARLIHPFGMVAPEGSRRQYAFRAPGAVITMIVLAAASMMLLTRTL